MSTQKSLLIIVLYHKQYYSFLLMHKSFQGKGFRKPSAPILSHIRASTISLLHRYLQYDRLMNRNAKHRRSVVQHLPNDKVKQICFLHLQVNLILHRRELYQRNFENDINQDYLLN